MLLNLFMSIGPQRQCKVAHMYDSSQASKMPIQLRHSALFLGEILHIRWAVMEIDFSFAFLHISPTCQVQGM